MGLLAEQIGTYKVKRLPCQFGEFLDSLPDDSDIPGDVVLLRDRSVPYVEIGLGLAALGHTRPDGKPFDEGQIRRHLMGRCKCG